MQLAPVTFAGEEAEVDAGGTGAESSAGRVTDCLCFDPYISCSQVFDV